MTAAIIADLHGRVLIVQRPGKGLLGGLWKFPGGERMPEETLEAALMRHAREELGIRIRVKEVVASVKHAYTHFRITLHAFRCTRRSGDPRALGCAEWQWADLSSLGRFPFSKAERKIIKDLS
jgi:A/G-specific adenine glycosylase